MRVLVSIVTLALVFSCNPLVEARVATRVAKMAKVANASGNTAPSSTTNTEELCKVLVSMCNIVVCMC